MPTASRDLHILVGASLVSALGDWAAIIALWTTIHETSASSYAVAGLFIALWLPLVLLAGPAGRLADRFECRNLVIAGSLAQAAAALALAFAGPLALILPLVAVLGAATAVVQPAEFALVPHAVGEDSVARANGRMEAARAVGATAGPLVGGLFAAAGIAHVALLLDAATFAAVALAALALHARRSPSAAAVAERDSAKREHALAPLLADRTLRAVIGGAVLSLVFVSVSAVAEVFFAKDVLGAGDVGFAALIAFWTAGMVIGASGVAARVPARALATAALVAVAVQGAGIAVAAIVATLAVALGGYLVGGIAHGAKNALVRTLMHERVAEHRRGRAFAAYNGVRNGAELGALAAGGVLVGAIGAQTALLIAGLGPVVIGMLALRALPRERAAAAEPAPATA